ncbi:MAG: M23 family metallopeptidase [Alphaproteobacteria bacterium]|nr:M23 family metallopeptidase [Alphaproteobacteria bacterium]
MTEQPIMTEQPKAKLKSRRSFVLVSFIFILCAIWGFENYYVPDENNARISARPVPARPFIAPQWLNLPPMHRQPVEVVLEKGDTLMEMLGGRGIDASTADKALDALRLVYDPRRLQEGQTIRLLFEYPAGATQSARQFAGLDLIPAPTERVIVRRLNNDQFEAVIANRPLTDRPFLTDIEITSSLYEAARASGMAPKLVLRLIQLFSFTVDFQREIRQGDRLEVLYTRRFDPNGAIADEGEILFAALTNKGERKAYWQYKTNEQAAVLYYDIQGKSMTRLLMKTPLDGARLSSRFGIRKHPILGYTSLHRGVDFAARRGTPIYAAGDGIITALGREGDWGRRIRIEHGQNYKTLYAHLRNFASGLKVGDRVTQGQIIGHVGSSGLATGPHLHYEITHNNKSVNPLALNLPAQNILATSHMADFAEHRQTLNKLAAELAAGL